jgi:hypothetical protein
LPIELAFVDMRKYERPTGDVNEAHAPLLRNTFTPGGRESIPALIAEKASSSGTGVGLQVIIMSPCYE